MATTHDHWRATRIVQNFPLRASASWNHHPLISRCGRRRVLCNPSFVGAGQTYMLEQSSAWVKVLYMRVSVAALEIKSGKKSQYCVAIRPCTFATVYTEARQPM